MITQTDTIDKCLCYIRAKYDLQDASDQEVLETGLLSIAYQIDQEITSNG